MCYNFRMEDTGKETVEVKPEKDNPVWLERVKKAYVDCNKTVSEGRHVFGGWGDNAGFIKTEQDLAIRNEVFQVVDQLKESLPPYILIGSEEGDFARQMQTPFAIPFRNLTYFSLSSHDTYTIVNVGNEKVPPELDPENKAFVGIDRAVRMDDTLVGVSSASPQTKYLTTGQVHREISRLISSVSSHLQEAEKERIIEPLKQRVASLEGRRDLVIAEGFREYGKMSKKQVLALMEAIPERFKKGVKDPIWLGIEDRKDVQDDSPIRELFFLPEQGEIVFALFDREAMTYDMINTSLANDSDWFHYSLMVAGKTIRKYLPEKYSRERYTWTE